jgi:hypothetical protein
MNLNQEEAVGRLQAISAEISRWREGDDVDPESVLTVVRGIADQNEPFLEL